MENFTNSFQPVIHSSVWHSMCFKPSDFLFEFFFFPCNLSRSSVHDHRLCGSARELQFGCREFGTVVTILYILLSLMKWYLMHWRELIDHWGIPKVLEVLEVLELLEVWVHIWPNLIVVSTFLDCGLDFMQDTLQEIFKFVWTQTAKRELTILTNLSAIFQLILLRTEEQCTVLWYLVSPA
jgi:hypothetical protein